MKITIYQKPTCTTCKQVYKALTESGLDFDSIDHYQKPLTKSKIKELLAKMGIHAKDLVRTKEEIYKQLNLSQKTLTEEEWSDLLAEYPDLIQRPIVEKGPKAILARPAERIIEFLK